MIEIPNDQDQAVRVLHSISRFSTSPETREMCDWLKEELARMYVANQTELDEIFFRQRQGACQAISKILLLTETADKTIEKIRVKKIPRDFAKPNFHAKDY